MEPLNDDISQSCRIARNTKSNYKSWMLTLSVITAFAVLVTFIGYSLTNYESEILDRAGEFTGEEIDLVLTTVGDWMFYGGLIFTILFGILLAFQVFGYNNARKEVNEWCR